MPVMPFIGVRISWLTFVRNWVFTRAASARIARVDPLELLAVSDAEDDARERAFRREPRPQPSFERDVCAPAVTKIVSTPRGRV
jgi:hypothetical protein